MKQKVGVAALPELCRSFVAAESASGVADVRLAAFDTRTQPSWLCADLTFAHKILRLSGLNKNQHSTAAIWGW